MNLVIVMKGQLESYPDFHSQIVSPRPVVVWQPPGYPDVDRRYPVLYMHDGQNLFEKQHAYGGVDWGIDPTLADLIERQIVPPTLVVGIWNTARRWQEYMPQRPLSDGSAKASQFLQDPQLGSMPISDAYLQFLLTEVKPFIDRTYPTRPERESTFIMGSSMGGLISLYALCEYPDQFAGAGCLSTHWPAGNGIVVDYLRTALPRPGKHLIYFDYGSETLDAQYAPYQERVDKIMQQAGYTAGRDWMTKHFPGAAHHEASWRERVHIPLTFLLAKVG